MSALGGRRGRTAPCNADRRTSRALATKFKSEPPKASGPDLLRRNLAYKIQENAYGGLDQATARLLRRLMTQFAKTNGGHIVLPRRVRLGVVLVRIWKGNSHRVTVLEDGFIRAPDNRDQAEDLRR
jgi:Protein of unknown function (DUF2924)